MKPAHLPFDANAHPALAASWATSLDQLAALASTLDRLAPVLTHAGIEAIGAAGSLGRLEAHGVSDFDALLLGKAQAEDRALAAVFAAAESLGLRAPKADGIFRLVHERAALLPSDGRGSLAESPATFGKRMQLLLDARGVWGKAAFDRAREEALEWYAAHTVRRYPDAQWSFLLNDLKRYLHAYAAWQQFKFSRSSDDGWYLRQAKLRSSRVLTFAGLMLLLGASSTLGHGKFEWVASRLALTPLARIEHVMAPRDQGAYAALVADHAAIHARLADPALRETLVATSPTHERELDGDFPEPYAEIHRLGGQLLTRLTRFVLEQRSEWHPDFFTYLML